MNLFFLASFLTSLAVYATANPIAVREEEPVYWGNATVGGPKVLFGDYVPSDTLGALWEHCSTSCTPGQPISFPMIFVKDGYGHEQLLEMTVEGFWLPEGEHGSLSELLAVGKKWMQMLKDEGYATVETDVAYTMNPCPDSRVNGCPSKFSV